MDSVIAAGIGLLVGMGLWFPYKAVLNRLVAKKREATSLLNELAMKEQEHMQQQQWVRAAGQYQQSDGTNFSPTWVSPSGPANNTAIPPSYQPYQSATGITPNNMTATGVAETLKMVEKYEKERLALRAKMPRQQKNRLSGGTQS